MATIRQKQSTYAITILTFQRKRHFQRTQNAELFIATLFRYRDQRKFHLHAFVVMPDYVHILCTPSIDQTTSRCVQLIKGGYSFAAREQSPGEIWHSGYFEHHVRDAEDYAAQLKYIENNPHRKNYIDYPHVHLAYPNQLDELPPHLASER
ncbi:MAG TPA: transposase [Acidobacteriaceae bacterium]|nr:transposase [Acidobacteriaceae bacterium]